VVPTLFAGSQYDVIPVNPWILQSRWPLAGVPLWDRAATDRHARVRRGAGLARGWSRSWSWRSRVSRWFWCC